MTVDLPMRESISEAYEVGPIVEVLVGEALWRLSARQCIAPARTKTWTASYERRRWINIDGVATWHWVNEGRLPTAESTSAEDCLRRAVSFVEGTSPAVAVRHGTDVQDARDLVQDLMSDSPVARGAAASSDVS